MVSLTSDSVIGVFVYAVFWIFVFVFSSEESLFIIFCRFWTFLHLGGVVVFVSANAPAFCFCVVASVWVLREGDRFISLASTIYLFQFSISLCLD